MHVFLHHNYFNHSLFTMYVRVRTSIYMHILMIQLIEMKSIKKTLSILYVSGGWFELFHQWIVWMTNGKFNELSLCCSMKIKNYINDSRKSSSKFNEFGWKRDFLNLFWHFCCTAIMINLFIMHTKARWKIDPFDRSMQVVVLICTKSIKYFIKSHLNSIWQT